MGHASRPASAPHRGGAPLLHRLNRDEARARVTEVDSGTAIEAPLRRLFAQVWLENGEPERVLALLASIDHVGDDNGDAEVRMLRARALTDLERLDEARSDYDAAVAANAALEDHELRRRLGAKVTAFPGRGGGPALKVISNDDTDLVGYCGLHLHRSWAVSPRPEKRALPSRVESGLLAKRRI